MSIEEFYEFNESLAKELTSFLRIPIADRDVMNALYLLNADQDEMDRIGDVWDLNIAYEEALAQLENFDFETLSYQIEIEDQCIPAHFVLNKKVRSRQKDQSGSFTKMMLIPSPQIRTLTMLNSIKSWI